MSLTRSAVLGLILGTSLLGQVPLSFSTSAFSSNWTIGQPVASPASFTDNLTLTVPDTIAITSSCGGLTPCPWLTVTPTSVNNPPNSVDPSTTPVVATIIAAGL